MAVFIPSFEHISTFRCLIAIYSSITYLIPFVDSFVYKRRLMTLPNDNVYIYFIKTIVTFKAFLERLHVHKQNEDKRTNNNNNE